MITSQLPASCIIRALSPTCSIPRGYRNPKRPHSSIRLLQPRPRLSHTPCGDEPPRCHAYAHGQTLFYQRSEARLPEELPEFRREHPPLADGSMPESCNAPLDIGVDDRLQVRVLLTVVSGARQSFAESGDDEEYLGGAYTSSGRHGGGFPPFFILSLGGAHQHFNHRGRGKAVWSSEGDLATRVIDVSSFPAELGSVGGVRAAASTSLAWRQRRLVELLLLRIGVSFPQFPSFCVCHQPQEYSAALYQHASLLPYDPAVLCVKQDRHGAQEHGHPQGRVSSASPSPDLVGALPCRGLGYQAHERSSGRKCLLVVTALFSRPRSVAASSPSSIEPKQVGPNDETRKTVGTRFWPQSL